MTRPIAPYAEDAERAVLGAVFLRSDVAQWLDVSEEDFHNPRHRAVWAAVQDAVAAGRPVDPVTVEDRLRGRGRLEAVGGLSFLSELAIAVPTADNVEHYAGIVRAKRVERELLTALGDVRQAIEKREAEGDGLLALAMERFAQVRSAERPRATPIHELLRREMHALMKLAERKARGEEVYPGVPTGLRVDVHTGGLPLGLLSELCGRPSHGKTSVALQIMENAAALGVEGIYCGYEDGENSTSLRIAAKRAGVSGEQLRNLSLDAAGWRAVMDVVNAAPTGPRWRFVDVSGAGAEDVVRICRSIVHQQDPKRERKWLVVVDYAQLMKWPPKADNEQTAIALNVRALGAFCKRDNLALLLLVQLNREVEKRDDKRPRLSDLRGSGELEQHGRLILGCHYEAAYADLDKLAPDARDAMLRRLQLWVMKNHDGRTNVYADLYWDQARHRIANSEASAAMEQGALPFDDAPPPTDDETPF